MPVQSNHSDYADHVSAWKKIRDTLAGEDAIKLAGKDYLPQPTGLDTTQYNAYKERAMFFGASRRTINGLLGAVFRKEPEIVIPERFERLKKNVDLAGTNIFIFARMITREVMSMARYGVLVDITDEAAARAYMVAYHAENIINWRERNINGVTVVDQVILKETIEKPASDGFGSEKSTRYRVLELEEQENGKFYYVVRLFEKFSEGDPSETSRLEPTVRGKRLEFIPFQFFGVDNLEPSVDQSPIKELVDVNVSHYRTQADLEHGGHWTALPTPWITGYRPATEGEEGGDGDLLIGSQTAWAISDPNARVGMLEFTGAGLSALEERADKKEKLMVLLGARLLEDQKKAAETAESKRIQYSGENSILAQIVNTVSMGLTQCLSWAIRWESALSEDPSEDVVNIKLNTDFFDQPLTPSEVDSLVKAWQSGAMSRETMIWNFKRGELLQQERTVEEEIEAIDDEGPSLSDLTSGSENMDDISS